MAMMDPLRGISADERFLLLNRWLLRTFRPIVHLPRPASPYFRAQAPTALAAHLDWLATLEVAWQCGYFGGYAGVPFDESPLHLSEISFGDYGDSLRERYVDVERVQLRDRLKNRLESHSGDSWDVPADMFSRFLQVVASAQVRNHFSLLGGLKTETKQLEAYVGDRQHMVDLLLGDSSPTRDAAVLLNSLFEFAITRYNLVKALGQWPIVQRSVMLYLDDAAWAVTSYAAFVDSCVKRLESWPAQIADEEQRDRMRDHVETLKSATAGLLQSSLVST